MKHWVNVSLVCAVLALVGAAPLIAQTIPPHLRDLGDALNMDLTFQIMQREAMANSRDLAESLFSGQDSESYVKTVTDLFDPNTVRAQFDAGLVAAAAQIDPQHIEASRAFFNAPFGARIIKLELAARAAMGDLATRAAAEQAWAKAQNALLPEEALRVKLVQDIVAANDLIEANVTATLNANLAFYQGMSAGGAFAAPLMHDQIGDEVASQEDEVRRETTNWLLPFLFLAYQSLSIEDLKIYSAFSKSDAGRSLSKLLFAAFDTIGRTQSIQMGRAAGRLMQGQDI